MTAPELRGLTLLQPWATLIAFGVKKIETRSWLPGAERRHGRFEFLVHAGARVDLDACADPRVAFELAARGITSPDQLPTSAVLAVAHCYRAAKHPGDLDKYTLAEQGPFGVFGEGRCYWFLSTVTADDRLPEPVPCKGRLGLWRPTPEVLDQVRSQLQRSVWVS